MNEPVMTMTRGSCGFELNTTNRKLPVPLVELNDVRVNSKAEWLLGPVEFEMQMPEAALG